MSIIEEKIGTHGLLEELQEQMGVNKPINSELWHACAGPLVTLPYVGSLVYYFPQGHSEQVAATTNKIASSQVPNYPNLPSQLLCQVLNATLHADKDTDEIFAQMSLQPLNSEKDGFPIPDIGMKPSKHPSEFFCKTLTLSDTSTHGGFSVPRRAAEKIFPQLDFSMQPPTQELIVRDLHDNTWTFHHIYSADLFCGLGYITEKLRVFMRTKFQIRYETLKVESKPVEGQPKRHLLTTGWSSFVGAKRLKAGDTVIFIRNKRSELMLGIRRANRQQTASPSSVLSADSMQIGVLAAAAHAASNRSPFTIFYNPRACPSEFVIPLLKYRKSVYGIQLSIGMRFGMMFESEESGKRRYMGIITGISDADPLRWPGSKWHNLQVEWDEPGCGNLQNRVSPWEIESPESLFIFPSLTSIKRPFDFSFLGEQTEWDYILTRPFIRPPQPANDTGPVSPIIQKALTTPETVNTQNLVNELPSLSTFSPLKQETWDFQKEVYDSINIEVSNGDSSVIDPSFSSVVLDEFCGFKDGDFGNPSDYLLNNNFSLGQELPANSSGTTSSNGEFNETVRVQNGSWQQLGPRPRVRTYTKIQKAGSVGRSIDVSSFKNYDELRCEIERMFGIEGMLNDSVGSGWKLVYLDFENDVLLVGDDPWEEFVGCVRCIRVLSPCEVRQMGEEGMQLLNNSAAALQALMTVRNQTQAVV